MDDVVVVLGLHHHVIVQGAHPPGMIEEEMIIEVTDTVLMITGTVEVDVVRDIVREVPRPEHMTDQATTADMVTGTVVTVVIDLREHVSTLS